MNFFSPSHSTPEREFSELIATEGPISTHLSDFSDRESYVSAALQMLDRERVGIYVHGALARHHLHVSRWDQPWRSYYASLALTRFDDDGALSITVTLYSTDAPDNRILRLAGDQAIGKLIELGFVRISR